MEVRGIEGQPPNHKIFKYTGEVHAQVLVGNVQVRGDVPDEIDLAHVPDAVGSGRLTLWEDEGGSVLELLFANASVMAKMLREAADSLDAS